MLGRRQGSDGLASEMDVHFGVEHAFEGGLHEGADQAVEVVEGLGWGSDVAGELLGLELEGLVHERISVTGVLQSWFEAAVLLDLCTLIGVMLSSPREAAMAGIIDFPTVVQE